MPIEFTQEDLSSEQLENKIFNYLVETLGQETTDKESKANDNLVETLRTFFYGTPQQKRTIKNNLEIVALAYLHDPQTTMNLVDRLHELCVINTGNEKLDNAIISYARPIISHFIKSENLLSQISIEHLKPLVSTRGVITQTESFPKQNGVQMGRTLRFTYSPQEQEEKQKEIEEVKTKDIEQKITFYVKAHQNFSHSSTSSRKTRSGDKVDYRELMIYKILEHTKFGPKSSFCVHPFARGVVLIATQAADFTKTHLPENKTFTEGEKIEENILNSKDSLDLNGIDLMARVLNITDLNSSNYGRVAVNNENGEEIKNKWKIIDFRITDQSRRFPAIYQEFTETINNDSFVVSTNKEKKEGGFVQRIVQNREMEEKSKIAAELVGLLDSGSEDDKKLSLVEAVDKAYGEVCEFLDEQLKDERNARCLRLNDKAVKEIKAQLTKYKEVTKNNYQDFKNAAAAEENTKKTKQQFSQK